MFSLYAKLALIAAIALGLAMSHWKAYTLGKAGEHAERLQERAEAKELSDAERESNRLRARAAEGKHAATEAVRVEYVDRILKEVIRETAPVASCIIPSPAIVRLNAAAHCAREDRPAADQSCDKVPDAR